MSIDTTFKPVGQTVVVSTTAVQVRSLAADPGGTLSIRVRNLSGSAQYFSWGSTSSVTCTAPAAGAPQPNTIGMIGSSVETFEIPQAAYFIASSSTGFEMTPGQGS
jgi:hypothetical protein